METQQQDVENPPETPERKPNYRIPIETIVALKEANLSNAAIARQLKCHPSSIYQRLQHIENTKKYVKHRSLIFASLQTKILQYVTDAKLRKAPLDRLIWSLAVLYDKERLESDKSTSNIAYASIIRERDSIKAELVEISQAPTTLDSQGVEIEDVT